MYLGLRSTAVKDRRTVIEFTLEDAPCRVTEDYVALLNRPNSLMLNWKDIHLGFEHEGRMVYEGDLLKYEGKTYRVFYCNGFKAISLDSQVINLSSVRNFKIVSNIYSCKVAEKQEIINSCKLYYKAGDLTFQLRHIIGADGNRLWIHSNSLDKSIAVLFSEVCQGTGTTDQYGELEYFDDSTIILCHGDIVRMSPKVGGEQLC